MTISDPDVAHAALVMTDVLHAWGYSRVETNGANINVQIRVGRTVSEDEARQAAGYASKRIHQVLQAEGHPEHSIAITEFQKWKT